MRITKIEIERYKGIKSLSLSMPSATQLIAGANNSGKSTIISAIELFFSGVGSVIEDRYFKPKNQYYNKESVRALTKK